MRDLFAQPEGATPVPPQDQRGLRQTWITTRAELNAAEQANILAGRAWALRSRVRLTEEAYLQRLHKAMFGDVWRWAGQWRTAETNIGVLPYQIAVSLRQFLSEVDYWLANDIYVADELIARYHHRLVQIHPFPNGNGRHGRLAADLLCRRLGMPLLTWGRHSIDSAGATRQTYLAALRSADRHDFGPLLAFIRT